MRNIIWILLLVLSCNCKAERKENKEKASELSEIKLYYAEAYYMEILQDSKKLDTRQAFINVSESFNMPDGFIDKKDLKKDTIHFNVKQRVDFLKRMNYSEKDTIFIYDFESQKVKKRLISQTPLMACINMYSKIEEEYKKKNYYQSDYEIGFNLGKTNYNGFAVIGGENPFIEKGLKPLVFEKITTKDIKNYSYKGLLSKNWNKKSNYSPYIEKYENIRFFVKINEKTDEWKDLIIVNTETKDFIHINQKEGESTIKVPLIRKSKKADYGGNQWVGRLFKNKPPIIFGFTGEIFGCDNIYFLKKDELSIIVLCDNRH